MSRRSAGADRFPSTHWSDLRAAAADHAGGAGREALAALLRRYLPALRVYLERKRRLRGDAADELLQSFVTQKMLDTRFVASADRERGRFRNFLLTALDHFLIDHLRHERAAGTRVALADDALGDDELTAVNRPDAFDVAWARQVMDEALQRMRAYCDADRRRDLWDLFDLRVVGPTLRGEPAPAYDTLIARLGFASPTQASNALVTAKRMFERMLRAVVIEYAGDDGSVEGELRDLREILSRAGARSE